MSQTIGNLFQAAVEEGALSPAAMQALNINDIGAQIQAGLGVSVDDVNASEAVIVTIMPDDSSSIRFTGNSQVVRDGHNLVVESLQGSKQKNGILIHTRYLNGQVLFPYVPIDQAIKLDSKNYNPDKGTPLYDQTIVMLGTVLAKTQDFSDNGVPCRSVSLIVTDGADEHSKKANAQMVKTVVEEMLRKETHIIAAMGIDDGHTDFRSVFQEMGIRDEWILTPKNNESEIRRAFQVFSQSAVRASQGAASFSQAAVGGFGS